VIDALVRATDYTDQAQVTNWPARIVLVVVVAVLIGLALLGMRRGWINRQRRQAWIAEPLDAPNAEAGLSEPVPGLFIGTAMAGDWMDRVAVHDLGVRSRSNASWGDEGIWFDRTGARGVFIPAADIVAIRVDAGIAGTVKARDSVVVVTWRLGQATVETGFRADDGPGHRRVLDGVTAAFGVGVLGQGDR
jgi:hypothetical protein